MHVASFLVSKPLIVTLCCAAFLSFSSCRYDNPGAVVKSEASIKSLDLAQEDLYAISKISLDIMQRFQPEKYIYVFLGQSPTPFHAFFVAMKPLLEQLTFTSIPYSSVKSTKGKIELVGFLGPGWFDKRDFFQKMISHFDLYLGDLLLKEIQSENPRRIVIIDYTQTGHSLGEAKRQIDFYLHHLSLQVKQKARFSGLKTEYLALADNSRGLKERIDEHKEFYKSNISGIRWVEKEGLQGAISSKLINIDRRVKRLNESLAQSWYWDGEVFDINSYPRMPKARGTKLLQLIRQQEFDPFSLHGSWYLSNGQLGEQVRINPLFLELASALSLDCSLPL